MMEEEIEELDKEFGRHVENNIGNKTKGRLIKELFKGIIRKNPEGIPFSKIEVSQDIKNKASKKGIELSIDSILHSLSRLGFKN